MEGDGRMSEGRLSEEEFENAKQFLIRMGYEHLTDNLELQETMNKKIALYTFADYLKIKEDTK